MKYLLLILIGFSLYLNNYGATIKGYVVDKVNLKPIYVAQICLDSCKTGAVTDKDGFFILQDVRVGKHIMRISSFGYASSTDSIEIKDEKQIVNLTIELDLGIIPIDTISEIEDYHRYFNKYKSSNILKIVLDSLSFDRIDKTLLKVYSTFYNKTDKPIYVIRDIACLRMIEPRVTNSEGKLMRRNATFIDCMGEKTMPGSSDFIKILPNDSISYPPVYLYFNRFSHYPIDNYHIALKYHYIRRIKLPGVYRDPKLYAQKFKRQMYYYNMALRGDFKSINFLKFNNSKIAK
jgi:hypothetical protein